MSIKSVLVHLLKSTGDVEWWKSNDSGSAYVEVTGGSPLAATTPTVYNVTMTLADTEYFQALPANTKKFTIKCQDGTAFRLAYVTGKVATPTAPYRSIFALETKSEDNLKLAAQTLYFACDDAGKVIEIEAWS